MSGSVAELVRISAEQTGFPKTFVEQRARQLQAAGRLRVVAGRHQPPASPRDLVTLLFGLTADKARNAPRAVSDFEVLERLGEIDSSPRRAFDALEATTAQIWAGDREQARGVVRLTVHPEPEIAIVDAKGREGRFYPPGTLMACAGVYDVTRTLEVPLRVVAAIGAELGHKACSYAI